MDRKSEMFARRQPHELINHSLDFTGIWNESHMTQPVLENRESQGCNIEDDEGGEGLNRVDVRNAEAGLHRINTTSHNWSDLISHYRTIQSPSKKRFAPNIDIAKPPVPSESLMNEVRTIKQDGGAIVAASQSRGFFSRGDPEPSKEELDTLLPSFEDIGLDRVAVIAIDSRTKRGSLILSQMETRDRCALMRTFMSIKSSEVRILVVKSTFK